MPRSSPTHAIPGALNITLLVIASAGAAGLLWAASHTSSAWVIFAIAVVFSFVGNTIFSLLHESVHGIFHSNKRINEWCGNWAAAFFPTAFSLQRGYHLTHHQNNRSVLERFDYFQPGDIKWLKYMQWYSILTGVYWVISVLGALTYLITPQPLIAAKLGSQTSRAAHQTSSVAYLKVLDDLPPVKTRLELLFALSLQTTMFFLLDLNWVGWLSCYLAFGLNWSSLQYADHAFSPLHVTNGAWNLKVNKPFRLLFLNYHFHLAHHQNPQVPWIYLPKIAGDQSEQPSYLRIWLSMWRGPRPLPREGEP